MPRTSFAEGRAAACDAFKVASDFSFGAGVPGLPVSVNVGKKNREERLPGMPRWTSRGTIERAFEGVDTGLDDQAIEDAEIHRGRATHPAIGAAVAAALGHFGLKLPPSGTAIAAALGGGAGAMYNDATRQTRGRDMAAALQGVRGERSRFPIRGQARATASESTPLTIQSGGAE